MKDILPLSERWLSILAGVLFVAQQVADAAPLPNAWQITDNSAAGRLSYTNHLTAPQRIASTNLSGGFRYMLNGRFLTDFGGSVSMAMAYGLGTRRYLIWWELDSQGDLIANMDGAGIIKLTTNGTGSALYHTHEIVYNPLSGTASYVVDGHVMTNNWAPSTFDSPAGQVAWGAGSSSGRCQMNINAVGFTVTGLGTVASYDAGTQESPALSVNPTNQGWGRDPVALASGMGATSISPDSVRLPSAPMATTHVIGQPQPYQAQVGGWINPGGMTTTAWFEWGTTASYGNRTPPQFLLSDTNALQISQTITGLSKGITYHVRSVASNSLGTANGQDVSFTTAPVFTVRSSADAGYGSMRQAITDARPGDTITLNNEIDVSLTSGELLITNDLTIAGLGPNIVQVSANDNSRVFRIAAGAMVTISGLTISGGRTSNGANSTQNVPGGDAAHGGGIHNSGTLTLSNCVVLGNQTGAGGSGFSPGSSTVAGTAGGRGGNGAGIYNVGALTLIACTVSGNSCGRGGNGGAGYSAFDAGELGGEGSQGGPGGPGGSGAGVYNLGNLNVIDCTIQVNTAGRGGNGGDGGRGWAILAVLSGDGARGGAGGAGGGVFNGGTCVFSRSTANNNLGGNGGPGGSGPLIGSVFGEATDGGDGGGGGGGGGIFNSSVLNLTACTLSGNRTGRGASGGTGAEGAAGDGSVSGSGGAVLNTGSATLAVCTISGNGTGDGGDGVHDSGADDGDGGTAGHGGGIYNRGILTLHACTISRNSTGSGGDGGSQDGNGANGGSGGGVFNTADATLASLRSTLIALNLNGPGGAKGTGRSNTVAGTRGSGPDVYGVFRTEGHNLVGRSDLADFVPAVEPTDYIVAAGIPINPSLGPLTNNGGSTFTIALLPGSLAIDAGDDSLVNSLSGDQRGYLRRSGQHVDIGAFEVQVADPTNPPLMTNSRRTANGVYEFSFTNNPGLTFRVLASTNVALPLTQWIPLGTATEGPLGHYHYADSSATNHPLRFFMLRAE